MAISVIRFLNIILAALLAGVSFGIWIGFNPMGLSPQVYLEQQQNMLQALRGLMVFMVFTATVITLISGFLQKNDRAAFTSLLAAAVLFITCILITGFGNKPIDDLVMTWNAGSIPDNWTDLRNKWWSMHIMRTLAEIAALLIITWSQMKKA